MSAFWSYILGQPWAMEPGVFARFQEILHRHAIGAKLAPAEIEAAIGRAPDAPNPRNRAYQVANGVALIPIQGVLAKHAEDVGGISQPRGTSYESIQRDLTTAIADPQVQRILLHIESPGGAVDGIRPTVEAIRTARQSKPVEAFIDGMGCSAAFWLAAACDTVTADDTAMVGSIGVIMVMEDWSGLYDKAGVKVMPIRSGPHKAIGQMGEKITPEQVAPYQGMVDQLFAMFTASVGEFRGLSDDALAKVSDGKVYLAGDALGLGLVDAVAPFTSVLDRLAGTAAPLSPISRGTAARMGPTISAVGTKPSAPPAGAAPASPVSPAGTTTMKITAEVLAKLVQSAPQHAALISAMAAGSPDKGPADEGEITAAITKADIAAKDARIAALEASATAAEATHKAALAAKDQQIATLSARVEALGKLGSGAPAPVGGDPNQVALGGLKGEALWQAEFERSAEIQEQFGNDPKAYIAHKKHEAITRKTVKKEG